MDPHKNEVSLIFLLFLNKIFLIHEKKKKKEKQYSNDKKKKKIKLT